MRTEIPIVAFSPSLIFPRKMKPATMSVCLSTDENAQGHFLSQGCITIRIDLSFILKMFAMSHKMHEEEKKKPAYVIFIRG